ncbi:MAG: biotin/lipoyl-binding protein, partial [Candidatus Korobacteraceae bacterium]
MPETDTPVQRKRLGKIVSVAIPVAALITGLLVISETNRYPRTDDAEVFANFIGIAPQVDGPLIALPVQDNQFVKQGELLFEIDPRPYEYALEKARSDLSTLEGQIVDESRTIASQQSAVGAAQANTQSTAANVDHAASAVHEAEANVAASKAEFDRAQAELQYTSNNFHRIEPLLAKQFVTVDQVDQARTAVVAGQQRVDQARSQVALAEAQLLSAKAQYEQARAVMSQSHAQLAQSQHSVLTLEPLTAQREGRAAIIRNAEYNLNNCRVYAPFDARVTNLTISQGAYAHTGQQVFTLIDTRVWWAVANFRETQLRHIKLGMHADVYVLSRPNVRYDGTVDSVGFGVQPDSTLIGT